MAEIHNLQVKTKLLHAQSLLLSLGESEAAKALQKVVDRLGCDSPAQTLADDLPAGWRGRAGVDLDAAFAAVAKAPGALEPQDALLLADIEARLTNEMRGLVAALRQFSSRAQLLGEEIPERAHFCKLVTALLVLLSLQLSNAFGKDLDVPIFFDDGAEYLRKLNLSLGEFVRELTLDGRRFLAVALIDQQLGQLGSTADRGDKC